MIEVAKDDAQLEDCYAIRKEVFVEEQGVDPNLEYDAHEDASVHFLLSIDGTAAGTVRYRTYRDKQAKIERMAIRAPYRHMGFGSELLAAAEIHAKNNGYESIILNSQSQALPFYQRLGYETEGDEFMEAGIAHIKAVKKLI